MRATFKNETVKYELYSYDERSAKYAYIEDPVVKTRYKKTNLQMFEFDLKNIKYVYAAKNVAPLSPIGNVYVYNNGVLCEIYN